MKSFESLVVLKRPQGELWTIMRDHLTSLAERVDDIEEIRELQRSDADGVVHLVNQWRMRQQIPVAVRSMLKIGDISWIDRNRWDGQAGICHWTIEPGFLAEHIACSGRTVFAEAMGGRGTRVTFAGELDVKPSLLGALGAIGPMVTGFVESIATTIIPRNFRAVAEAAVAFRLP
ncbi:MAG TPA: hypothetical protein VFL55_00240 [Acetobacteraceae bacterium]|nr:hypothetical protein [Acetobacteraceae bacterium]